jgi:hypothetical protein
MITAHTPRYNANGSITLLATFPWLSEEVPFSASPNDSEAHGRELYQRAMNGEFGPIAPYVAPHVEPVDVKAQLTAVVQAHLDATARTRGYDSIVSACSYAGAPNQFQAESQQFLAWRANVWTKCYEVMADVDSGARPVPTAEHLISELPPF